jgi:hypothetical protein
VLVGQPSRLGSGLEDVRQPFLAQSVELALVEPRLEDDLGQELEACLEPVAEGQEAGPGDVPRRVGVELDPEPFARLGEGVAVETPGPGDERLGGEGRDPRLRLGLGRSAPVDEEVDADEIAVGQGDGPDRETIRERVVGEVREVVRPGRPGRRAGRIDGRHAASSASASSSGT